MTDLCRECGAPVSHEDWGGARLCSRHLHEARRASPPFACTPADMAARDPDNDPECESCGHPWSSHTFDGCQQITAKMVISYGEIIQDDPPHPCGCREIDPMCCAPEPMPEVASLARSALSPESNPEGQR